MKQRHGNVLTVNEKDICGTEMLNRVQCNPIKSKPIQPELK